MSACLAALVVLAFMSLFSAKYRVWTREAFDCVARRLTLRPCETKFNQKVRAKITAKLMKRSPKLARITHKKFEAISWVFTIILFISLAYTVYGIGNLIVYGTCDPVTGNCIFNPGGDPNQVICPFEGLHLENAIDSIGGFKNVPDALIEGKPPVYFIGTTWCPHCNWERPVFTLVADKFSDYMTVKQIEIDQGIGEEDGMVFTHYSPEGKIPLIVIGGKYFRIGAGETLGKELEENVLTALFCKVTNNPIEECSSPDIQALVNQI